MNLIYWAIIGLGAFVAIWMLFVVPAERRHHERKLEIVQKRIKERQARKGQDDNGSSSEQDDDIKES
jgi:predicted MFS family arabinose efflux permease